MPFKIGQILAVLALLMFVVNLTAQEPPTPQQALAEQGFPFTTSGFVAALKSPDGDTRSLAASLLAEQHKVETTGEIRTALRAEPRKGTAIKIAEALGALGDSEGYSYLATTCRDQNEPAALRVMAADQLLKLKDESCNPQVIAILENNPRTDETTMGLQYLRRAKNIPASSLLEITSKLGESLRSKDSEIRSNSARIIAAIGGASSVPVLESAAAREQNPEIRRQIEDHLRTLQARIAVNQ